MLFAMDIKTGTPEELAQPFINDEKGVPDAEAALAGASDIIAERISDDAECRKYIKELIREKGCVRSEGKTAEETVYSMYYDYREPVSRVPNHRVLAMNAQAEES